MKKFQYWGKITPSSRNLRAVGISKASLISETKISNNVKDFNLTNASVIQEQVDLVNANSSYICWFTQNSDGFTYASGGGSRNPDGTHFNEAGLAQMATDAFTNINTTLFTKTPVSPTPLAKISLAKISTSVYTVSANLLVGVSSYVHAQWTGISGYMFVKYNQANGTNNGALSTTMNSVSIPLFYGLSTGFLKDNLGRISMIPYVNNKMPGARVAAEGAILNSIAYPNPLPIETDLVLDYDATEGITVIESFDKNGKILYSNEIKETATCKNTQVIPSKYLANGDDLEFVYVRIKSNDLVSQKKIMLQK